MNFTLTSHEKYQGPTVGFVSCRGLLGLRQLHPALRLGGGSGVAALAWHVDHQAAGRAEGARIQPLGASGGGGWGMEGLGVAWGLGFGGWGDDELFPEMGSMRCKIVENNLVILMVILRTTHILLVAQSTHASNLTFPYTGHWTDPVLNQGLWGVFILVLCNLAMLEEGFLSVFRLYNK